jgi:hypothetical protein
MIMRTNTDTPCCHQEIAESAEALHSCAGGGCVISNLRNRHHLRTFAERECGERRAITVTNLRRACCAREFVAAGQDCNAGSRRKIELTGPAGIDHRKEGRVDQRTSLRKLVRHLHILSSPSNM